MSYYIINEENKPGVLEWNKTYTSNKMITKDSNPKEDLQKTIGGLGFFSSTEPALVHPGNTSLVKLRDNGMIDIFSSTNQGIRIDPNTKSITIITNRTDIRTTEHREWIEGNSVSKIRKNWESYVEGNIRMETKMNLFQKVNSDWTITIGGNTNIITTGNTSITSKGNTEVKSDGSMSIESVGSTNIKAAGSVSVTSNGNMSIESKGTMKIKSGGNMTFDAPRYDHN